MTLLNEADALFIDGSAVERVYAGGDIVWQTPTVFDSFEDESVIYGGGSIYWGQPAKLAITFKANVDCQIYGARWWRKTTFSGSDPVLYLAEAEAFAPAVASQALSAGWSADGWETIVFDDPPTLLTDSEWIIWVTTMADIDLARDLGYFDVPKTSIPNGLITSLEPSAWFNHPKIAPDNEAPVSTAPLVSYWLFPIVF